MSRTFRKDNKTGKKWPDGEMVNFSKDKKPKKSFVYPDEHWATKSNGGSGNKRGWKTFKPKWYYKKKKTETI